MVPSTLTVKFIVLIISLLQTTSYAYKEYERKLISKINPGCNNCEDNATLIYVQAVGHYDIIHEIWDFTGGPPTMIFVLAGKNSSIHISWDGMKPEQFLISEHPFYCFATSIDRIYEYNDVTDAGHYDWHTPQMIHSFRDVKWQMENSTLTEDEAMIIMRGKHIDHRKGVIKVKMDLLPHRGAAAQLPHLIHTANSTNFDISLVNLTTYDKYNSSRFALHMIFVSTDSNKDMMRVVMRKSLDDEHTPGVFEMIEIKTPRVSKYGDGGFIQFRPVAYRQAERGVASSTLAHLSELERANIPDKSTLYTFFDLFEEIGVLVEDGFVSFGEPGDGFYSQHNFTAWSFTIGYGVPPIEVFSIFVIIVITVGLSLPVILAISGIAFVIVKRFQSQRRNQTRLAEED